MRDATRVVLTNVYKSYGDARAIDGLSLDAAPGELFALVGPSGSGKSTVLRCLAGLERPDSGTIAFDGQDVNDTGPADRHVSVVFQNYALYPHLTVYENVAFGLVARAYHRAGALKKFGLLARPLRTAPLAPDERARIRDTIALVELTGLEQRVPSELSGGRALDVFTTLPLIVPGTAIAIALVSAYNAPPLELHQTAFIVVVALAVRRMPYAVRALSAAKAQMDPVLAHSAATLGATPAFATMKVFLPLLMPAIAGSAVLVFVTAVTEVSSTILLAPANWTPASVHVYNLVHELALSDAAAYAIGLVALVAALERPVRRRAFSLG